MSCSTITYITGIASEQSKKKKEFSLSSPITSQRMECELEQKEKTQTKRFELLHPEDNGLAVHRLNHSATTAVTIV
jgi:hypothetical protein